MSNHDRLAENNDFDRIIDMDALDRETNIRLAKKPSLYPLPSVGSTSAGPELKVSTMPTPEELGRLSSEAVKVQYDTAAKAWEAMGISVKDRIAKLESALTELHKDLHTITECAGMIREKGNLVVAQIDESTTVSNDIRTLASDLRKKIS